MKRFLSYLLVVVLCCSAIGFATGCESADLSAVNSKIEQLEKDLAAAKAATDKITQLEKDLAAAIANGTSSQSEIDKLKTDLAKAIADSSTSTDKITQLEKDLAAAVENATSSQAEIDKLKTDLAKAIADSSTSTDKITQLEKDLAAAIEKGTSSQEEIDKLKTDLAAAIANGTSSQEEIDKLKTDLAAAIANGTSSQEVIDKLKADLAAAEETITKLDAQLNGKFDYNLNETITHYVKGQKVFDLTVTKFEHNWRKDNTTAGVDFFITYEVIFPPEFALKPNTAFTATLYDKDENRLVTPSMNVVTCELVYNTVFGISEKTIVLYYLGTPIASLTITPVSVDA